MADIDVLWVKMLLSVPLFMLALKSVLFLRTVTDEKKCSHGMTADKVLRKIFTVLNLNDLNEVNLANLNAI